MTSSGAPFIKLSRRRSNSILIYLLEVETRKLLLNWEQKDSVAYWAVKWKGALSV